MKVEYECEEDKIKMIKMLRGLVFLEHLENHLKNNDIGNKPIPEGEIGCTICGKTVLQIFKEDKIRRRGEK